jgi:hypothetical protein
LGVYKVFDLKNRKLFRGIVSIFEVTKMEGERNEKGERT